MQTRLEAAVAGEVLAEVKRQRYTYKEIQERADVKPRVWAYYFTAGDRSIPFPVLAAVCDVLGVKPSEMVARAEAQIEKDDPITAQLEARLSPQGRDAVERGRRAVREQEAGTVDPPRLAEERTLRSA